MLNGTLKIKGVLSFVFLLLTTFTVAQDPYKYMSKELWEQQFQGPYSVMLVPFKILDNLYYVGAKNIGVYLFTSDQGHILLDSGMPGMAPGVLASIQKLGFKPKDVKILINTHAHVDHVGGHSYIQEATGAKVYVMDRDAEAVRRGIDLSPLGFLGWKPVKVDRVLKNGDTVKLGGWELHAVSIPGHTPGATLWTAKGHDSGRDYNLMFGGIAVPNPGVPVVGNPKFPKLAEETLNSIDKAMFMRPPDILLTNHPMMNLPMMIDGKIEATRTGVRPHPLLISSEAWRKSLEDLELAFKQRVQSDEAKLAGARK